MPVRGELFIEKLARTRCQPSYLPQSRDRLLAPLLAALQAAPEDNRTLVEWARALHTTERTLARRCQKELGMSLGQWRTRLRLVKALDWLRGEMPVQEIAWRLGYASTSAFIAMFQREQGCAPSAIASSWANPWPEPHEKGRPQAPLWITGWA